MQSVKSVIIHKSNHLLLEYLQYGKKPMNASNNDDNHNIVILINISRMLIKILEYKIFRLLIIFSS